MVPGGGTGQGRFQQDLAWSWPRGTVGAGREEEGGVSAARKQGRAQGSFAS